MMRAWQAAPDDEWLPRQLRLHFIGGPSGDSDSGPPSSDGNFSFDSDGGGFQDGNLGGSNFGTDTSSSNFGTDTSGTSTDGGFSDGGGFQSTSSGYSSDSGGGYSDSGGYYSFGGTDGGSYLGGDTGGGYLGGSSLGGNLSADAASSYGGGTAGASPFGGGGFQTSSGFNDSATGQGFGNFLSNQQSDVPAGTLDALTNQNAMPTINIAAPYEGALSGPDVMAGGRGPSLSDQLGINDIGGGRNASVDAQLNDAITLSQSQSQQQQAANQTGNQLASDIAAALGRDTTGVNNFQNITAPLDLTSPMAPAYAPYAPGESRTGPEAPFGTQGRTGAFEQEGFNPMNTYQAPAQQNQGTQGLQGGRSDAPSLLDMLSPNQANAGNLISSEIGGGLSSRGDQGQFYTPSNQQANELNTTTLNDLAAQFGRDPATITNLLNNAAYEGPLGGPDVVGDRSQSQQMTPTAPVSPFAYDFASGGPFNASGGGTGRGMEVTGTNNQVTANMPWGQTVNQAPTDLAPSWTSPGSLQGLDPSMLSNAPPVVAQQPDSFDSRFGDQQQQSQQPTPAWMNADNLTAGVRGGQELFAQAPQSLNETLQAARSGDPNVMAPPFATMPWGTTFAPPTAYPAWNAAQQLEGVRGTPETLARAQDTLQNQYNQTLADRQAAIERATQQPDRSVPVYDFRFNQDVPLPRANPLDVDVRTDPTTRTLTRTTDETRAPTRTNIERAAPPLQVTVPGRTAPPTQTQSRSSAQTQSRSSSQAAQQASRGDRSSLDALLTQARTAPTLAGRIAALDALNGAISAMRAAGLPNPYGRDPDPGINAALRMGR